MQSTTQQRNSSRVLAACIAGAVLAWAAPFLYAWWVVVHASPAASTCSPPTEHEQLHVTFALRDGRVAFTGCMYIGPRGAYPARRP